MRTEWMEEGWKINGNLNSEMRGEREEGMDARAEKRERSSKSERVCRRAKEEERGEGP